MEMYRVWVLKIPCERMFAGDFLCFGLIIVNSKQNFPHNVSYNSAYLLFLQYKRYVMTKFSKSNWLPAKMAENISIVAEQIRLARLRRDLSIEQVAERAQCSRLTVSKLEKGLPTVSIGVLLRVLYALQLGDDFLLIARDDKLGHIIQDIEVKNRKRASRK